MCPLNVRWNNPEALPEGKHKWPTAETYTGYLFLLTIAYKKVITSQWSASEAEREWYKCPPPGRVCRVITVAVISRPRHLGRLSTEAHFTNA